MNAPTVNVLWTSGWDSTYRVASLLLEQERTVQPWYVLDSERRSTKVELATQERISSAIKALDSSIEDRLLPLRTVHIDEIPADSEVTQRYKGLLSRGHLGSQYDWLSRFAKWQGITLELGIELRINHGDKAPDYNNGPGDFLRGNVEPLSDGTYRLRPDVADDNLQIFSPFVFPILNLSKPEMFRLAQKNGFGHIMEMTWFCFNPLLDGSPCGECHPCRFAASEGLDWRIPAPSLRRKVEASVLSKGWGLRIRAAKLRRKVL